MQIVVNQSTGVVAHSGPEGAFSFDPYLVCTSFMDNNATPQTHAIYSGMSLPQPWADGAYTYNAANGQFAVLGTGIAPTPALCETALQLQLDGLAQSWGYADMATACTYVGDPCAKFGSEATALRAWRSACWQAAEALDAQIAAGTAQAPANVAAFLVAMPAAPARPAS